MLLVDVLEDAGFVVIEAANSDQGALELTRNPDIAAMLTDVEMPGHFDGIELAQMINRSHPTAAVLVMSGRARPALSDLPPGARFFTKPYTQVEIVEALRQMMSDK
jgi:CheY-like chemotaxis protein